MRLFIFLAALLTSNLSWGFPTSFRFVCSGSVTAQKTVISLIEKPAQSEWSGVLQELSGGTIIRITEDLIGSVTADGSHIKIQDQNAPVGLITFTSDHSALWQPHHGDPQTCTF